MAYLILSGIKIRVISHTINPLFPNGYYEPTKEDRAISRREEKEAEESGRSSFHQLAQEDIQGP